MSGHKKIRWRDESPVGQLEAALADKTVSVTIDDGLDEVVILGKCPSCKGEWDLRFEREPMASFLSGMRRGQRKGETVHSFRCNCPHVHKSSPPSHRGCGRAFQVKATA